MKDAPLRGNNIQVTPHYGYYKQTFTNDRAKETVWAVYKGSFHISLRPVAVVGSEYDAISKCKYLETAVYGE